MPDSTLRTLTALRRLRRVETDGARRGLGEALTQKTALTQRDAAIERELREGLQISGDFDRQAFSAWLGRIRIERAALAEALREAKIRTTAARADLAHRRVAETAAEDALARKVSARDATLRQRDQVMLEDVARALKRMGGT